MDIEEDKIENEKNNDEFIGSIKEDKNKIKRILESRNQSMDKVIKDLNQRVELIKYIRKNYSLMLTRIGGLSGGVGESGVSRALNKKM